MLGASCVSLVACEAGPATPKAQVLEAVDSLASSDRVAMSWHVETSPRTLRALARSAGVRMSPGAAKTIASSSLGLEIARGDSPAGRLSLLFEDAGVLDVRVVANALYVRMFATEVLGRLIPSPELAGLLGFDPRTMKLFTIFTSPEIDGKWVRVGRVDTLVGVARTQLDSISRRVLSIVRGAIRDDAAVEARAEDPALGTSHVAETPAGELYDRVRPLLQEIRGLIGPRAPRIPRAVPDRMLTWHVWVDEGHVTRMEVDLLPFLHDLTGSKETPPGRLVVRADFHEFGGIARPEEPLRIPATAFLEALRR